MRLVRFAATAVALSVIAAPVRGQAVTTLEDVARALGGVDRVRAVGTIILTGTGRNYNLGQGQKPYGPLPLFEVTEFTRTLDLAAQRWRQEATRVPRFVTANTSPQRQVIGLDGEIAYTIAASGAAIRNPTIVATGRRQEFMHHPLALLQAALAPGAEVRRLSGRRGGDAYRIHTASRDSFDLVVDRRSRMPATIMSFRDDVNLGDVVFETSFGRYQEVQGLMLPTRMVSRYDRWVVAEYDLTGHELNPRVSIAAPDTVRAMSVTPPVTVASEEVAPGVWYLTGGSHHSVLIEFADHLMLIEVPQNDARTLAVIAKARELRPQKPLRYAVTSHHHFDHSGGVRAAMAEGLTLVTHSENGRFLRDVAARPHTIQPDALARSPKAPRVVTVGNKRVFADAARTVELYHIRGNPHAATLLMAYLPADKLLVEADVYTPPAANAPPPPSFPFVPNLLENIARRKLVVERIVPLHGRIVPLEEVRGAAAPKTAP